jgi:1-acyl-sn-glycerol-3-phosphate acyltransferase/long-chain acyl-CoA synthetase
MTMNSTVENLAERAPPTAAQRKWSARLFEAICRNFLRRYCRLVVSGTLPHGDAPLLVCSNHTSHLDSIAIIIASGVPFESCALLAAQDYFFRDALGLSVIGNILNLIPVNRFGLRGFRDTLQHCRRYISSGGRMIVAFPEGSRGTGDELAPFKRGPAVLSARLRLPVVPVWVGGTHDVMPKGSFFPRRGTVSVAFGEVLQPADPMERPCKVRSANMTSEIACAVRALGRPTNGRV